MCAPFYNAIQTTFGHVGNAHNKLSFVSAYGKPGDILLSEVKGQVGVDFLLKSGPRL